MKTWNKIITLIVTGQLTALTSSVVLAIIYSEISTEGFILGVLIISTPVVLIIGTPIALFINRHIKLMIIRIILHIIAGFITILLLIILLGGGEDVLNGYSMILYISGITNSVIYLIIFSLLKRTGKTGFED